MKLIFVLLCLCQQFVFAQTALLKIPFEVQRTYENKTRTPDGKPGEKYWLNYSKYKIKAEFNPYSRILKGTETIIYKNNSPDRLNKIVVKLYQDITKKEVTRYRHVANSDLNEGTKVLKVAINDKLLNPKIIEESRSGTQMILKWQTEPNDSVKLEIDWEFIMPLHTKNRFGTYDSTSFFIAYWYPQIGVYDDIYGWDMTNYNGLHEFYQEFADYDVEITVPKNQIIWATGELQNPLAVFSPQIFERFIKAMKSKNIISIISKNDIKQKIPLTISQPKLKWHFKANHVVDFSFATSNHYIWDGASVTVDNQTGRNIFVSAVYRPENNEFSNVAEIAINSVEYLSFKMPGIPFPYPQITVFDGSGGMEFPMMVNQGLENSRWHTVFVTSHEIAHSYFPFFMGINQVQFSWMDEGWAMLLPSEYQMQTVPSYNPAASSKTTYQIYAGTKKEMPMMVPSISITGYEYYIVSYYRSELAYRFLEDVLGKDLFKKCLHEYINRWNGKHPGPYDFFFTFNDVAKEDLAWYWKPWFFDSGYPDLSIQKVENKGKDYLITIKKIGNIPVPIALSFVFVDNTEQTYYQSARIWKNKENEIIIKQTFSKKIKSIVLGNEIIPDIDEKDNHFEFK